MGEETGRKSALRNVKLTILIAIVFTVSLTPAVGIRFFPDETATYLLEPAWSIFGSRMGLSKEAFKAFGIVTSFLSAIISGSALLFVLFRELARSVRQKA
jgi:hypothetical protein